MEIRVKKCKSGNVWKLVNESWSNSRGWGHETTVMYNNYSYDKHRVKYLNRTWEMYRYQTCMSGAINIIYEESLNRFIEDYKNENNIIRFKKGEKEEVINQFNKTEFGKDLLEVKEAISLREFE